MICGSSAHAVLLVRCHLHHAKVIQNSRSEDVFSGHPLARQWCSSGQVCASAQAPGGVCAKPCAAGLRRRCGSGRVIRQAPSRRRQDRAAPRRIVASCRLFPVGFLLWTFPCGLRRPQPADPTCRWSRTCASASTPRMTTSASTSRPASRRSTGRDCPKRAWRKTRSAHKTMRWPAPRVPSRKARSCAKR